MKNSAFLQIADEQSNILKNHINTILAKTTNMVEFYATPIFIQNINVDKKEKKECQRRVKILQEIILDLERIKEKLKSL